MRHRVLACHYHARCSSIALFDQSETMLAQSLAKADRFGVTDRCTFLRGDVLGYEFPETAYDTVLVGLLVSHQLNNGTTFDIYKPYCGRSDITVEHFRPAFLAVSGTFDRKVDR